MLSVLELVQEAYNLGKSYDERDHLDTDEYKKLVDIEQQIIEVMKGK